MGRSLGCTKTGLTTHGQRLKGRLFIARLGAMVEYRKEPDSPKCQGYGKYTRIWEGCDGLGKAQDIYPDSGAQNHPDRGGNQTQKASYCSTSGGAATPGNG